MTHKYLAPKAPAFRTRIEMDGNDTWIKFTHGVFTTEDDNVATALDSAIEQNVGLGLHIRKADMAEANALAAEHQKTLASQVHAGALHSGALDDLKAGAIPASGNAMEESAPNNPEALQDMQDAMASEGNKNAGEDVILPVEQVKAIAQVKAEDKSTIVKPLTF